MKRLFRKVCIYFFDLLQGLCNRLENAVFKLDKFIERKGWKGPEEKIDNIKEMLSVAFKSTDAFKSEFDKYMDVVLQLKPECEKYRELLYYNFSLRYFVAYYEGRFDTIPLQVYNEYRMAYDHFVRNLIIENSGKDWDKALNHTLRGVLDVLKLNCFRLREYVLEQHESIPSKARDFISDGNYIKVYSELQVSAEFALWEAKRKESEIRFDSKKNVEVVNDFIKAFFMHMKWDEYQREHKGKSNWAAAKYRINIAFKLVGVAAILKVLYDKFGYIIEDFISRFMN